MSYNKMQNFIQKYPAKYTLLLFGLVAGVLSSPWFWERVVTIEISHHLVVWGIPSSIVFGLAIGVFFVFYFDKKPRLPSIIIWIIGSWLALEAAISFSIFFPPLLPGTIITMLIIVFLTNNFIKLTNKQKLKVIAIGYLLSLTAYMIVAHQIDLFLFEEYIINREADFGLIDQAVNPLFGLFFYVFWQTGVAFLLGWTIDKTEKKEEPENDR